MPSNMMLVTAARQLPQLQLQLENLRKSQAEAAGLIERYTRLKEEAEETLKLAEAKIGAAEERVTTVELLFTSYMTTADEVLLAFADTFDGRHEDFIAPEASYHEALCHVCNGPCQRGTEGGSAYVMLAGGGRVLTCSEACVTRMMAPPAPKAKPAKAEAPPPPFIQTALLCERCRCVPANKHVIRRELRGRFCQPCINAGDNSLRHKGLDPKLILKYLEAVPATKAAGITRMMVIRAGREFEAKHGTKKAPAAKEEAPPPAVVKEAPPPAPVSMDDLVTAAEMWRDGTSIDGIADCLGLDPEQLGKVLAGMSQPPKAVEPVPVVPEPKKRKSTPLRLTEAELGPLLLAVLNGSDAAWPAAKLANELAKEADTHDRRFTGRRLISDISRYLDACADRGGVVRNENVAGKGVTYRRKYNPLRNQ